MQKTDTAPAVQELHDKLWRKLSFEERFLKGLEWMQFSRELLLAGMRQRHPDFTETEIRRQLLKDIYRHS